MDTDRPHVGLLLASQVAAGIVSAPLMAFLLLAREPAVLVITAPPVLLTLLPLVVLNRPWARAACLASAALLGLLVLTGIAWLGILYLPAAMLLAAAGMHRPPSREG